MKNILIIGSGPTGLTLANFLNKYNIDYTIIDKVKVREKISKALTLTTASLKTFQKLGIEDQLIKNGNKIYDIDILNQEKERISRISKLNVDSLFNYYLSIPQYITEEVLLNLFNQSGKTVQNSELISINKYKEGYHVKTINNGCIEEKYYDYLIGCDGAKSTTRKILNIPFSGIDYKIKFLIADIKVDFNYKNMIKTTTYIKKDNGFIGFFPITTDKFRLVMSTKKESINNVLMFCLSEMKNHYKFDYSRSKLIWHTLVDIKQLYAGTIFPKNIFLLGDAWHIYSPVGGRTLNTGIQDASDLAWRLSFYIKNNLHSNIFHDFLISRRMEHDYIKEITSFATNLLIEGTSNSYMDRWFPQSISNRQLYKKVIPEIFSGLRTSVRSIKHSHIRYVTFSESNKYSSTYDLSCQKITIITDTSSLIKKINNHMIEYVIVTEDEMKKLVQSYYDVNKVLIVSPNGFIINYTFINNISKNCYLNNN